MQNSPNQERHEYRQALYRSAMFWSIGNSFTSSTLVLFLFNTIKLDTGAFTSWIFAGPCFASVFRLLIPYLLNFIPARKSICIISYILHVFALASMLALVICSPLENYATIIGIITCWTIASIFEGIAYIVFLSWNKALFPREMFVPFFSRREVWRLVGDIIALLFLAGIMQFGSLFYPANRYPEEIVFGIFCSFIIAGLFFILISIIWLRHVPEVRFDNEKLPTKSFREEVSRILRPFYCRRFLPMLVYGGLFSFFMQLEQVAQFKYISLLVPSPFMAMIIKNGRELITRVGQMKTSTTAGFLIKRFGTLNVMWVSQAITALGILCYIVVTKETYFLFLLSGVFWIAYVGINVALPKMQFEFCDSNDDTPWLVAYSFIGGICGAAGIFLSGWIYDNYSHFPDFYPILFTCAFGWRLFLVIPLLVAKWMQKPPKTEDAEIRK